LSTIENPTEEIFIIEENKIRNYKFPYININEKQENQINLTKRIHIKIIKDKFTQNDKR